MAQRRKPKGQKEKLDNTLESFVVGMFASAYILLADKLSGCLAELILNYHDIGQATANLLGVLPFVLFVALFGIYLFGKKKG